MTICSIYFENNSYHYRIVKDIESEKNDPNVIAIAVSSEDAEKICNLYNDDLSENC